MRELSLHILDALENSVEAGASRLQITVEENLQADLLVIEIVDNGHGMEPEAISQVMNPFYSSRTTRHVGLGLPLFLAAARRCDGDLVLESKPGIGTRLKATFCHSHVDRAPLGEMASALLAILLSERPVDVAYTHRLGSREFRFDSSAIREELGDVPLTHPRVRDWLFQVLEEGEADLASERPVPGVPSRSARRS